MYKGAGKCDLSKGEYAGTVTINYTQIGDTDEGYINVTYNIESQFGMEEAHLYIGCDPYPTKNGATTVAPGQYTFNSGDLQHVSEWSTENNAIKTSGGFYVIAHAVACGEAIPDGSYIPPSPFEGGSFVGNEAIACKEIVTDFRIADFTAYPVPFDNEVNVSYKFDYDTKVTIDVYDIKGTLVRSSVNTNYVKGTVERTTIDLSKADNQMYFVRLTTDKGTEVKKIVSSGMNKQ